MTYNWNNMVSITVPTGTNGWLYSGELIINGVKVRFPVGVPTSVPEPAAVLLKKMIELEQEEDANTAKPQNHYVGDVTIPAGKTLTLEKGAQFVDNSGPTEVVILPETVVTLEDGDNTAYIMSPLSATPTEGSTAKVTYNGTEYSCTVALWEEDGANGYALGNLDAMGLSGGNPDAPFVVILFTVGMDGAYGGVMPMEEVTSITISIVQEGGASGGGASGDYIIVADATTKETTQKWSELAAAVQAGRNVRMEWLLTNEGVTSHIVLWPLSYAVSGAEGQLVFYTPGLLMNQPARYTVSPGENDSIVIAKYEAD